MTVEIGRAGLTRVLVHHDAEAREDAIRWLARLWPVLADLDAEMRRGRTDPPPDDDPDFLRGRDAPEDPLAS